MQRAIAKSRVAVEAADLNGVAAAPSRRGITGPGVRLGTELAGDVRDHSPRGVLDLGKEGAQESQSADLDSEAEHGGIFPATAGPPEVLGVEVEEPIELLDSGFSAEAAPPAGLRLAEEGDRHSWLPACRGCPRMKHG